MTLTDPVPTNLNSVMTEVQDWEGRAADAFDLEFLSPFSEVVRNQVDLTNQVLTGLLAEKAIIEAARFDAKTVAETTAETLRTLDFDDGPSGWQVALTVVGAVGVIGGTLGSGGLGWALLEVGAAVGPLFVDGPKGDTTVDVLVAMDSAVRTIRAEMTAQEELLAGALNRDVDTVQQYLKSHLLPARPLTTANVGGQLGEFRPPMESMI